MHTHPSSSRHPAAYQALHAPQDENPGARRGASSILAPMRDGIEVAAASLRPAATWTAGALGLGMFASAAAFAAHGRRSGEQIAALGGGLAGLGLYAAGIHDILRAAHTHHDTGAQSLAHGAVTSLAGVTAGTLLAANANPLVGFAGAVTAYFSAYYATSILTRQLETREAEWAAAPRTQVHGNRWLVAGLVVLGVFTLLFGWSAAVLITALDGDSPAAVTGKCVGTFVTLWAGAQVLPSLARRPLRLPAPDPDAAAPPGEP